MIRKLTDIELTIRHQIQLGATWTNIGHWILSIMIRERDSKDTNDIPLSYTPKQIDDYLDEYITTHTNIPRNNPQTGKRQSQPSAGLE